MLNRKVFLALFGAALAAASPAPALAYIGPGAGLGAIAVTAALVVGVLLLVAGLVWYPLKRLLKGRAKGGVSSGGTDGSE